MWWGRGGRGFSLWYNLAEEGGGEDEDTCKSHMVPCVARVRRCGQQEWAVHSRDRGTDIAYLIPDSILSLRLCVSMCVLCVCVHERQGMAW